MGGATSIDVTREGVDKAYGLKKLCDASGISLDAMMFVGDAIFPGGNDYPAKLLGLDTVRVRDPQETLSVIETIVACQKVAGSDRTRVVSGKSVSVRVDLGGRRIIKKKKYGRNHK